jgi:cytochrome c-type biogenesis protein CcsB
MIQSGQIIALQAAMGLYLLALLAYLVRFATRAERAARVASALAWVGLVAQTAMIVARGIGARHVPLVSMYEYLVAFSWMVVLAYLVFEARSPRPREAAHAAAAPALLLGLGLLAYAASLPGVMKQAEELMPILRSDWLIFHVSTAVVAYGAAGLASALACLYFLSRKARGIAWLRERLPQPASLDRATYRAVRFAFPFLTLVNVTGAVWAYSAWGRYWGWDPKETWALITWMIYVFYLHARLRADWRPARANAVVLVGIVAILFTFLGVNQLSAFSSSMHSYASGG